MSKIKDVLEGATLRAPSADLSRRVAVAFGEAQPRRQGWVLRPVPLWASLAAAVVSGVLGFVLRGQPPERVVYVIPAQGQMRRLLVAEERRPEPLHVEVRVNGRVQEGQ